MNRTARLKALMVTLNRHTNRHTNAKVKNRCSKTRFCDQTQKRFKKPVKSVLFIECLNVAGVFSQVLQLIMIIFINSQVVAITQHNIT